MTAQTLEAVEETLGETPRCRRCGEVPPKLPGQSWLEWEALEFCDDDCRQPQQGDVFPGCTHATPHRHGSELTYRKHRCRCVPCSRAQSRYAKARRHAREHGQAMYVEPDLARRHVELLLRRGLTIPQIARRAGVDRTAVRALVGRTPDGVRSTWVHRDTEAKLLAVTPTLVGPESTGFVDGTGTARRLQALAARGWTRQQLARHLNVDRHLVCSLITGIHPVSTRSRAKVRALYDQLWDVTPQPKTPAEKTACTKVLAEAERLGWAKPLEWDDDQIDNPAATPHPGDAPGRRRPGQRALVGIEDVEFLHEQGVSLPELVARLKVRDRDSIFHALKRANRLDLWRSILSAEQRRQLGRAA